MAAFRNVNTITGPISMVKNISLKGSKLCLPRYSARNLLPDVPKKFVTNTVSTRQKLKATFIVPRVSFPNIRATRILKMKGTKPTKQSAAPVYKEFLNRCLFSTVLSRYIYCSFLSNNKETGTAIMKPPRKDRITMSVRCGFAFFTAGSALSSIFTSKF